MNAFDFDKTIYDGDSTTDFYKYCLKKYPSLVFFAPFHLILFPFCGKTRAKQHFFRFLRHIPDVDAAVSDFWEKNIGKIKPWYKSVRRDDDVIISASPRFLVEIPCKKLGIGELIASEVDKKTGKYKGVNCSGAEKVRRFYEKCGTLSPEYFFSDSRDDTPMAKIAKYPFAVVKNDLFPWEERFR